MSQWSQLVRRVSAAVTWAVVGFVSAVGSPTLAAAPTPLRVASPAIAHAAVDMTADEWSGKHGRPAPKDTPKDTLSLRP